MLFTRFIVLCMVFHQYKCAFSSQAYDDDIDVCSNDDFTYYAFEAMTSVVATTTDEQQLSTQPTKRDPQKALDFWHWWLFELVPGAATVDLNALGWHMTYGRYTNVTR